jgi:hypothetical protein
MPRKRALKGPEETLKKCRSSSLKHSKDLENALAAVQRELEELKVANSQLQARERLLADTYRTLSLVAAVLLELNEHGSVGHDAAISLEAEIGDLFPGYHDHPDLTSLPQLQQDPGGTKQFLLNSVNLQHVLFPSSRSVLCGQPLSLLQCALIAFTRDPILRQNVASSMQHDHDVRYQIYENGMKEVKGYAQLFEEAKDEQAKREAAALMAHWLLLGYSIMAGLHITAPSPNLFQGFMIDDTNHPLGQASNPAQMEEITEKLGFSRDQVQEIMQGLQVFADLQRPLDKQVAALLSRIHQLLQLPNAPVKAAQNKSLEQLIAESVSQMPASKCESNDVSGSVTTAADRKIPVAAGAAGGAAAAGAPAGTASSAASPSATPEPAMPSGRAAATANPYEEFLLSSVYAGNHQELQPLLNQLHRAQQKLLWLDACAGWFVGGCFTWEQHIRHFLEAWPHSGSAVPFAKSLALRNSLQWLRVLEGQYGG